MEIRAEITGLKYKPLLCRDLTEYSLYDLPTALSNESAFILNFNKYNKFSVSWWVSAKRTRTILMQESTTLYLSLAKKLPLYQSLKMKVNAAIGITFSGIQFH